MISAAAAGGKPLSHSALRRSTSAASGSQHSSSAADLETGSKTSRSSRQSSLSEATQKHQNNHHHNVHNISTTSYGSNNSNNVPSPSPRSTLMPPQSRDRIKAAPSPKMSMPRNLFGKGGSGSGGVVGSGPSMEGKEDKKIAQYVIRLRDELSRIQNANGGRTPPKSQVDSTDLNRVTQVLTKIRMLLDVRVDQGDKSPLAPEINLGANIVEVMRQYPAGYPILMEECTCILYFVSVLEPSFKKGVARLFKAMADHKANVAIQRAACEAIRNVVQNNPDALPRIAPSLGVILQSMAAHGSNAKLIFKSIELLADLALEPVSKPLFVQKGGVGLLHILSAMNRHSSDASIQAAGCRAVANLSLGATKEVLQRLTPALDVILRAMNRHTAHKHVQLYGCWALGNLAVWHHADIVAQGGVDAILPSMREMPADYKLQEQGCAALSKLLEAAKDSETRTKYVDAITSQQGIPTILHALTQHSKVESVQISGLSVLLGCVAHSLDHHEMFLAEGGLDVMIRAMTSFDKSVDVASRGMELLKNFTRQSLDFQRAVFAKGGIGVVIGLMKTHQQAHSVQDPAFACLRNIAIHPENRGTVAQQGGIPTMINNMQIYIQDAAIQAYGCDALGRLAGGEPLNQESILSHQGIDAALAAMTTHPNHPGVQDRAIFFLLAMTAHPDAVAYLKEPEREAIDVIKQARIPQKEAAMERCEKLIRAVESKSSWFGRK